MGVPSPVRLRESDLDSGPVSKSVKRGVVFAVSCVSWRIDAKKFRHLSAYDVVQYVQSERKSHEQLREIVEGEEIDQRLAGWRKGPPVRTAAKILKWQNGHARKGVKLRRLVDEMVSHLMREARG